MEIQITNFLGVADVTIPLTNVPVAVMGPNASGKTSLATAIAAILSRSDNPLSLGVQKRPYMRDDALSGEILLRGEGGSEYRRWNLLEKGIRVLPGGPEDIGKAVLGLIDFCTAGSKARIEAWETCFLPEPSKLVEMVGGELEKLLSRTAVVDEVKTMLRTRRWEDCHAVFVHKAQECKRAWATLTGEPYGVRKADTWSPAGWLSDFDHVTPAEARTRLEEAREALRMVQMRSAVNEADVARAKEAKREVPSIKKEVDVLDAELKAATQVQTAAGEEFSVLRDKGLSVRDELDRHDRSQPVREDTTPCPACGEALVVGPDKTLSRARDEAAFDAHLGAWKKGRETLEKDLHALRVQAREVKTVRQAPATTKAAALTAKLQEAMSRLSAARRAANVEEGPIITDEDTRRAAEAEQTVDDCKAAVELINRKVGAQNENLNASNYASIAYTLGPKGIRSRAMQSQMASLTSSLRETEGVSGWPRVEVDTTYAVSIAGRPAPVSAASEQWRAQFLLQCAIALVLGEQYVIADGADILDSVGLTQFVMLCDWLAEQRVYAIACATGSLGELPAAWRTVQVVDGRTA